MSAQEGGGDTICGRLPNRMNEPNALSFAALIAFLLSSELYRGCMDGLSPEGSLLLAGTKLPIHDVRFHGECWGQSGLAADAEESTEMTHCRPWQPPGDWRTTLWLGSGSFDGSREISLVAPEAIS